MSDADITPRADPTRPPLIERLSGRIALLGGLLLLCVAALVVLSVIGRWLGGTPLGRTFPWLGPINGDFEMVQMATAIAVFAFLPYAQAQRGNIFVDTFTSKLSARTNAWIDAFWALIYAGMMAILTACLFVGTLEHYRSGQTTMLLQFLIWPAIAICTVLSALLACAALATAIQLLRRRA